MFPTLTVFWFFLLPAAVKYIAYFRPIIYSTANVRLDVSGEIEKWFKRPGDLREMCISRRPPHEEHFVQ